jgi:hypothetical protein
MCRRTVGNYVSIKFLLNRLLVRQGGAVGIETAYKLNN